MMEMDFIRVIEQSIRSYREFPLPAIIADLNFRVHWSNEPAKRFFSHMVDPEGLANILAEFDQDEIKRVIDKKGSITISGVIPFSGMQISFLPIRNRDDAMVGLILLLFGADTTLGVRDFYRTAKTATALSTSLRDTVDNIFRMMDVAAVKTDILDLGWIKASYESISNYCYRILRMSHNIEMYSQYQSGHLQVNLKAVDLQSLLDEWQTAIKILSNEMNIPIEFELSEILTLVSLDRDKFEMVFFNLLHNALYFTRANNSIKIVGETVGETVTLTVSDNGIGIPADFIDQVFRPYEVCDNTSHRSTMGLGLTLCQIIMQAHGGTIAVASTQGKGTTVTLTFQPNSFSQQVSLAQESSRFELSDRFSSVYTGLADAIISPYRD